MNRSIKNPISDTNSNLNGIDLLKFICTVLVCMLHIPPVSPETPAGKEIVFWLQNCLARIAVPFFFAASGFLFFRKKDLYDQSPDRLKAYCFRLLRLLGTWFVILIVGKNVQLWYFGAVLVAVILLYSLLKKKVKLSGIIALAVVLYIIGLIGDTYYGLFTPLKSISVFKIISVLYENTFGNTRNGVFFGFIFVLLGALSAHKKVRMSNFAAAVGLIISMILLASEAYFARKVFNPSDCNMYVSLLPLIYFLIRLAANMRLRGSDLFIRLRIIGVIVFFVHMAVDNFAKIAIKAASRLSGLKLDSFRFLLVLVVSILIAVIIERASRKEKLRWLRYLYS